MNKSIDQVYEIVNSVKMIQQQIKSRMHNHFRDMLLTAPQGMLIFMLSKHGELKISEISEKMGLSSSTVSGIVDRLEVGGFVERIRSEKDRRVVYVRVSEKGKEQITSHENLFDQTITKALDTATNEELNKVKEGLSILSALINQENEGDN